MAAVRALKTKEGSKFTVKFFQVKSLLFCWERYSPWVTAFLYVYSEDQNNPEYAISLSMVILYPQKLSLILLTWLLSLILKDYMGIPIVPTANLAIIDAVTVAVPLPTCQLFINFALKGSYICMKTTLLNRAWGTAILRLANDPWKLNLVQLQLINCL